MYIAMLKAMYLVNQFVLFFPQPVPILGPKGIFTLIIGVLRK